MTQDTRPARSRQRAQTASNTSKDVTITIKPNLLALALAITLAIVLLFLGFVTVSQDAPVGAGSASSLLIVFLTGLTAGGLTCLAVQGGLLATAIAQHESIEGQMGRAAPLAMFLGAKLAAYTLLGVLLGLFGALIGLTPSMQGWLQIAAGLFMVGVAAQMLNLHPFFRYFAIQPPKFIQRRIRQESRKGSLLSAAMLGALTVFIPCATTQAMMIAAMGTGSAVWGGLLMFAYTLGTIPLFFSLGYLATQLGATMRGAFAKVAAVAIIFLAVLSITAGLALLGVAVPDVATLGHSETRTATTAPAAGPATQGQTNTTAPAPASGTVQEVTLRADPSAYVPNRIVFKTGTPAKLKLTTGDRLGCTSSFLIPSLGVQKILGKNQQAVFDIPTDQPRTIPFTCSMGMYRGVIEVQS
ncbi:MAG: sulfite exporter TauE/SafE family protein [Anaerolineae bacterium]